MHVVNGIGVSIGIAIVHASFTGLAGVHLAQVALIGAVCASLADQPNTVDRVWNRVLAAGLLASAAAAMVTLLEPWPIALAAGIAVFASIGAMAMAWGPRAGPLSFAPLLSIVFTMGLPLAVRLSPLATAGCTMAGALVYLGWSVFANTVLQPRYRSLALAGTMQATAHLLRTRAAMLVGPPKPADVGAGGLRRLIADEAALAEQLQLARDLLFAAPDTPRIRRETAMLLHVIDLRDVLLASRLDLDRLGDDAFAFLVRGRVAGSLNAMAARLDRAAASLGGLGLPREPSEDRWEAERVFDDARIPVCDPRGLLLPALVDRLRHLHEDVEAIRTLQQGNDTRLPLPREALRAFVAPEGWPLAALRAQLTMRSPVLRHAMRSALALGAAYLIALQLPWTSHPHWLVLGVAVVLRGSLDQTLTRRNARVLGTVIGCLLVLAFSGLQSPAVLTFVFFAATGVAHAFVMRRYLVTAVAATLMALLQAHLADPAGGFAIGERLADTVLGAALAWGASYVLPSWERRSLAPAIERTLAALREYTQRALAIDAGASVPQRLARRQAYDALAALGGALQRSAAEPESVRPPVHELAMLLDRSHRLMAHLSAVRLMLVRRSTVLENPAAAGALQEARARLGTLLEMPGREEPCSGSSTARQPELAPLPPQPPAQDLLPWLLRRLQVTVDEAREVRREAARTLERLGETDRS